MGMNFADFLFYSLIMAAGGSIVYIVIPSPNKGGMTASVISGIIGGICGGVISTMAVMPVPEDQ